MHHLIIGALQEGRVNRGKGLETFRGESSGKGDGVLLGNTDIKTAFRKALSEEIEARSRRHRRRDRHNLVVPLCLVDQALGEHLRVAWWTGSSLLLLAGQNIEL